MIQRRVHHGCGRNFPDTRCIDLSRLPLNGRKVINVIPETRPAPGGDSNAGIEHDYVLRGAAGRHHGESQKPWKQRTFHRQMVRTAGLEPARLTALPPQSSVSANSTTCANGALVNHTPLKLQSQFDVDAGQLFACSLGIDRALLFSIESVPPCGLQVIGFERLH